MGSKEWGAYCMAKSVEAHCMGGAKYGGIKHGAQNFGAQSIGCKV